MIERAPDLAPAAVDSLVFEPGDDLQYPLFALL